MGDDFRLERPKRDENGEIILDSKTGEPQMETVMRSFSPEKFYEFASEHKVLGPMMVDAHITADDLSGVRSIGDALEALSLKLFLGGQQARAEATVHEGISGTLQGFEGFMGIIGQDPDIGIEIGTEVGLTVGLGLLSGGIGAIPKGLHGAGKIINKIRKYGTSFHRARGVIGSGARTERLAMAIGPTVESAQNVVTLLNIFRPGTTTGGNIAAFTALKYGKNSTIRHGAFIMGQMVDGAIGGGDAMISNNLYLQEEQLRLYGDTSIRWNDHLGLGIGMGMAGATVLGYGMRALGFAGVSGKKADAFAKHEADSTSVFI